MAYLGHPENVCVYKPAANTTVNATHLLWTWFRWVEAVRVADAWRFKNGRDAADWIFG